MTLLNIITPGGQLQIVIRQSNWVAIYHAKPSVEQEGTASVMTLCL